MSDADPLPGESLHETLARMTDNTTDPARPFTGQPHTDQGQRGKTEVKGIRFRDLADCAARAFVDASGMEGEEGEEMRQRRDDGTLNYNDVYNIPLDDIDPLAFIQNLCCQVEKAMGIWPNVPKQESDP